VGIGNAFRVFRPFRAFRVLPWLLASAAAVVFSLSVPGLTGPREREVEHVWLPPAPATLESDLCRALADYSARAAALTGSLALVTAEERPARAAEIAEDVRALARRASETGGSVPSSSKDGADGSAALTAGLAGVLESLAVALEGYAGGDPASLAGVRRASASNAQLRELYQTCGGE
jgi:hypothetical protein